MMCLYHVSEEGSECVGGGSHEWTQYMYNAQ